MDQEKRYVFVKNDEKCAFGFATFEAAKSAAANIEETDLVRVRVRMRSRTGTWDVVVKERKEVK